jgi:hypothetical protein
MQLQQKCASDKTIINCIYQRHFKCNRKGWSWIKVDIYAVHEELLMKIYLDPPPTYRNGLKTSSSTGSLIEEKSLYSTLIQTIVLEILHRGG